MQNPSPVQLLNRILYHLMEDATWKGGALKQAAAATHKHIKALRNARLDYTPKRPARNRKGAWHQFHTA